MESQISRTKTFQKMKGKSFSPDVRMHILRKVEAGADIRVVCHENHIAEQTIRRWKRQLGRLGVNETARLEEQRQKNKELRNLLVNSLLINRAWNAATIRNREFSHQNLVVSANGRPA